MTHRYFADLACIISITSCISTTSFAAPIDFGVTAGYESFVWEEFDATGSQLLEESGTRYAISGFLGNTLRTREKLIYRADAKLYFGTVDYDGQTQDGVALTSDTQYGGLMLEGEMGYRADISDGTIAWDFIGRGGFDAWRREIDDSVDASGRRVHGIAEQYTILNIRAGTGPSWQMGRWQGRLLAGYKLPLLTNEHISEDDSRFDEDVNLEPEGRFSPFLNFNNSIRMTDSLWITINAFYDSYRFDASDPELVRDKDGQTLMVWQPESSQDNYGFQAGVSFSF